MGIGAVLGGLGGGLMDFLGSKHLQEDSQAFSREQAKNQMQWRVEDLKRAGLNPMLSVMGGGGVGGAATPSGGSGHFQSNIASSAARFAELSLVKANVAKAVSEAGAADAFRDKAIGDTLSPGTADLLARSNAGLGVASAGRATQETENLKAGLDKIGAEIDNLRSEVRGRNVSTETAERLQDLLVRLKALEVREHELGLPRKQLESDAAKAAGREVKDSFNAAADTGHYLGGKAADLREKLIELWDSYKRNKAAAVEYQRGSGRSTKRTNR